MKQGLRGQPEFGLAFSFFHRERRQRDTQKPNPFRDGEERFEEGVAELFEFASRSDLHLTGAASRDLPEISEFDLERDGAAASSRALALPPHLIDDLSKRITCSFVGEEIGGKVLSAPTEIAKWRALDHPLTNPIRHSSRNVADGATPQWN